MNNNLPDSLPPISDLLGRSEILGSQSTSESPFPSKGKAETLAAAKDAAAETLDGILRAFSEERKQKAKENSGSSEDKASGKSEDFSKYDYLILCDGSVVRETGAMGIGIQVLHGDQIVKSYSLRLQDSKGEDYCGTSPVAELVGLIYSLYLAASMDGKIAVGTDIKNSVQWVNGEYKVNEPHIAQLVAYALHWREKAGNPAILEVARDKTAGVDDLARQAIGKGDRAERIRMTVQEFTTLLEEAGITNAGKLAAPQTISLDPEALGEFLKAKGVPDDLTAKAVQAVKEKDDS